MGKSLGEEGAGSGQGKTWLSRAEIYDLLNPHLLTQLKVETSHEVKTLTPTELLTPLRLDIMAKFIYATNWVLGTNSAWSMHVYREHLHVWNEFQEGDQSGKSSFETFKASFDELLRNMCESGFASGRGLIPIGVNNVIIDGAHRAAGALALNIPIQAVCFNLQPRAYNFEFFRNRGLADEILDDMALEYCRLDGRVRVAVLFPVAKGRHEEMIKVIEECGSILYRKSVPVSRRGRENLIKLLYRGEPWLGDGIRPTPGLMQHVNQRFVDHEPIRFVFFIGGDEDKNRHAKARMRALFDLGNDSVHINDTHRQTISIAECVLNANSLHFLNNARSGGFKNFSNLFKDFKRWIHRENLDTRRFCVDASAVLAAYGLRDANDLDYLYAGSPVVHGPDPLIACHNQELRHYGDTLDNLVLDPRNYFCLDGIKFLAIHLVRKMKLSRGEAKDFGDVHRIDALEGNEGSISRVLQTYYTLPERAYSLRFKAIRSLKQMIPKAMMPLARAIYRLPRRLRNRLGPEEQVAIYRGFELHYSRGTSLLEWIEGGRIYEAEVARHLVQALRARAHPNFLDIGANIGLMTFNILSEVPHAKIVAFEPGAHQAELLEKNVIENRLSDRVTVIRAALSNRIGMADFFVHKSQHASGDGFFDTRRAGRTNSTKVTMTTLDSWWETNGKPQVDAVKIDTEGAELWVLEGAVAMLDLCHPLVVFELHPKNIRVYPYKAVDILRFFGRCNYKVRTINGILVTEDNLMTCQESANDYVAVFGHD